MHRSTAVYARAVYKAVLNFVLEYGTRRGTAVRFPVLTHYMYGAPSFFFFFKKKIFLINLVISVVHVKNRHGCRACARRAPRRRAAGLSMRACYHGGEETMEPSSCLTPLFPVQDLRVGDVREVHSKVEVCHFSGRTWMCS